MYTDERTLLYLWWAGAVKFFFFNTLALHAKDLKFKRNAHSNYICNVQFHVLYFHVLQFHVLHFHVLHFHVLHFHALLLGPSFSCPALSCPAIWSVNFMSCNFVSGIFSQPAPLSHSYTFLQAIHFSDGVIEIKLLGRHTRYKYREKSVLIVRCDCSLLVCAIAGFVRHLFTL